MAGKIDLTGVRFGRLLVVKESTERISGVLCWDCICDCGNKATVRGSVLRQGVTKSCGCLKRDVAGRARITHGGSTSKEYRVWNQMRQRCTNPNNARWAAYGGRGITVCDRWMNSFGNFLEDMGFRPFEKAQLDRIDNNKGYSPENCHWVSLKQNLRNMRTNLVLTARGESMPVCDWAERSGIACRLIEQRVRRDGWDAERAIFTPSRGTR